MCDTVTFVKIVRMFKNALRMFFAAVQLFQQHPHLTNTRMRFHPCDEDVAVSLNPDVNDAGVSEGGNDEDDMEALSVFNV